MVTSYIMIQNCKPIRHLTSEKNMVGSVFMLEFQKDFSIFFLYSLVLICFRCSNKQGNILFDLVQLGLNYYPMSLWLVSGNKYVL